MTKKVRIEIDADVWLWVKTQAVSSQVTTSQMVETLLFTAMTNASKKGTPYNPPISEIVMRAKTSSP